MKRLIMILVAILFSASAFAEVEYDQNNEENFEEYGPVHDAFQEPNDDGGAAELHEQISDARGDFQNTVPEPAVKKSALAGKEHHKIASDRKPANKKAKKVSHKTKKQSQKEARHHAKKKHSKTVAKHKSRKPRKYTTVAQHKHVKKKSVSVARNHKKTPARRTIASIQRDRNSKVR